MAGIFNCVQAEAVFCLVKSVTQRFSQVQVTIQCLFRDKKNWRSGTFNVCMLHCPFRGETVDKSCISACSSEKIGETAASLTSGKELPAAGLFAVSEVT